MAAAMLWQQGAMREVSVWELEVERCDEGDVEVGRRDRARRVDCGLNNCKIESETRDSENIMETG